jgi:LCP family protein required for cell wall assembly
MRDGSTWRGKVNAIEREAGIGTLVEAMETTFGTTIDHHAQIDMDDLVRLVDAVGGVEVDVETRLSDPPIGLALEPGVQRLDGATALSFVRTRQDSDYRRADRHQVLLLALIAKLANSATQVDAGGVVAGLESLETDLPLGELATLLELARTAADATVVREVAQPPELIVAEGDNGDGRGYIVQPDVAAIRAWVDEHIDG